MRMRGGLLAVVALAVGGLVAAPPASADPASYLAALHGHGLTSDRGDAGFISGGQAMCKNTALYLRTGGDWSFFGARRKAAEDLVLDNITRPREDVIFLANTAIDELCPQYNYTWVAE